MQYRPTQEELLMAIADFIESDVRPQLEDRALAFRCLIAANLARMCVLERRMEEWHDDGELGGFRDLAEMMGFDGPTTGPVSKDERRETLDALNTELARAIREDAMTDDQLTAVSKHLKRTLKGRLAITNPRFDADAGWKVSP